MAEVVKLLINLNVDGGLFAGSPLSMLGNLEE